VSGLEAIGVAASLIQVAGVGLQLATTLRQYIEAKPRLARIAEEINTTAKVLRQVGGAFEESAQTKLCSHEALQDGTDIVQACKTVFSTLETSVNRHLPSSERRRKLGWPEGRLARRSSATKTQRKLIPGTLRSSLTMRLTRMMLRRKQPMKRCQSQTHIVSRASHLRPCCRDGLGSQHSDQKGIRRFYLCLLFRLRYKIQ